MKLETTLNNASGGFVQTIHVMCLSDCKSLKLKRYNVVVNNCKLAVTNRIN